MANVPYLLLLTASLASGGTASPSYAVPQGQNLNVKNLFYQSTGTFKVTGIRTSDGRNYTNASGSQGIPSSLLNNAAASNISFNDFVPDLFVDGGVILYIDLLDTSAGANTVNLLLPCEQKVA